MARGNLINKFKLRFPQLIYLLSQVRGLCVCVWCVCVCVCVCTHTYTYICRYDF